MEEKIYRLLYPMKVTLVTSVSEEGKPNIVTLAWNCPVSQNPPMVAFCITPKRYSYELISKTKEFVVNIPPPELKEQALTCGRNSGRDMDKFAETGLTPEKAELVKPPLIKECPVSIECKLVKTVETGDHVIVIGEAVKVHKIKEGAKGLYHLGGDEFTEA